MLPELIKRKKKCDAGQLNPPSLKNEQGRETQRERIVLYIYMEFKSYQKRDLFVD